MGIEEQAEQERKEREYAQKLHEYQRSRNARRPRETIVRGRDGRLYRYVVNNADTDDDAESLDYQEPATVHAQPKENAPVVSIPVHQVTSDARRPSDAASAMYKEEHVASSSSMEAEDDDTGAMEETTTSADRNDVIVEYASDDEDDIQSKANTSLVPNTDLGESWMEPVDCVHS